jgi:hypothetical protein
MRKMAGIGNPGILEAGMKQVMKVLRVLGILGGLATAPGAALAQEVADTVAAAVAPAVTEDWDALRTQAEVMRAKAKQMRNEAEAANAAAQKTCWEKFLVSSCLADAKQALRATEREAKRIEVEASEISRRIKAHEREVKQQRRIDEAPQRAEESAKRAEQIRLKEAAAKQKSDEKQADIARRQQGKH